MVNGGEPSKKPFITDPFLIGNYNLSVKQSVSVPLTGTPDSIDPHKHLTNNKPLAGGAVSLLRRNHSQLSISLRTGDDRSDMLSSNAFPKENTPTMIKSFKYPDELDPSLTRDALTTLIASLPLLSSGQKISQVYQPSQPHFMHIKDKGLRNEIDELDTLKFKSNESDSVLHGIYRLPKSSLCDKNEKVISSSANPPAAAGTLVNFHTTDSTMMVHALDINSVSNNNISNLSNLHNNSNKTLSNTSKKMARVSFCAVATAVSRPIGQCDLSLLSTPKAVNCNTKQLLQSPGALKGARGNTPPNTLSNAVQSSANSNVHTSASSKRGFSPCPGANPRRRQDFLRQVNNGQQSKDGSENFPVRVFVELDNPEKEINDEELLAKHANARKQNSTSALGTHFTSSGAVQISDMDTYAVSSFETMDTVGSIPKLRPILRSDGSAARTGEEDALDQDKRSKSNFLIDGAAVLASTTEDPEEFRHLHLPFTIRHASSIRSLLPAYWIRDFLRFVKEREEISRHTKSSSEHNSIGTTSSNVPDINGDDNATLSSSEWVLFAAAFNKVEQDTHEKQLFDGLCFLAIGANLPDELLRMIISRGASLTGDDQCPRITHVLCGLNDPYGKIARARSMYPVNTVDAAWIIRCIIENSIVPSPAKWLRKKKVQNASRAQTPNLHNNKLSVKTTTHNQNRPISTSLSPPSNIIAGPNIVPPLNLSHDANLQHSNNFVQTGIGHKTKGTSLPLRYNR